MPSLVSQGNQNQDVLPRPPIAVLAETDARTPDRPCQQLKAEKYRHKTKLGSMPRYPSHKAIKVVTRKQA
jgi:hypothetical protein